MWDLRTGRQHGGPLKGHILADAVEVGDLDGLPIAVTGGYGAGTCAPAASTAARSKATGG